MSDITFFNLLQEYYATYAIKKIPSYLLETQKKNDDRPSTDLNLDSNASATLNKSLKTISSNIAFKHNDKPKYSKNLKKTIVSTPDISLDLINLSTESNKDLVDSDCDLSKLKNYDIYYLELEKFYNPIIKRALPFRLTEDELLVIQDISKETLEILIETLKDSVLIKNLRHVANSNVFNVRFLCTLNNTHISVQTPENSMIASVTVTSSGFKRLERTARYPNFKTIIRIVKLLKKKRVRHLNIYSRGPGFYKRMFTNILKANFIVLKCINTTKYAHNGCKLRKQVRK